MRINERPKMALATLVGVFVLVFTLSIYFSSQSAASPQLQAAQITVSTSGNVHIVYVQYNGYCNVTYVSGSSYVHWDCIYNH